jgi:thymidylate synthase (FAD)|tara:strand:+ start:231 stop:884 length:654 start_codon:yes stop_codon:yes gene_type:complete
MNNKVKLISLTQPFDHEATGFPEDLIAYCARVSNPENQNNTQTAPRLLKFLIKHKHWSPFEMVDMCVEIKTSRAIAAQILRHRSFSFQEFSQRYSAATEIEPVELRSKAETNRQSSSDVIDDPVLKNVVQHSIDTAMMTYDKLITQGVAKEQARMVLPLTTQTTMYMKGSIRSWIHYIDLRTEENTQKEHRDIAEECKSILKDHFPNVAEALWSKDD